MIVRLIDRLLNVGTSLFFMGLVYLGLTIFLVQPMLIKNSFMEPSFGTGDVVFIRKPSYGYSRLSLPIHLPLGNSRIISDTPKRGDVIAFVLENRNSYPGEENQTYHVRRVVGLPGETISTKDGALYIDGHFVSHFQDLAYKVPYDENLYFKYTEQYPDGHVHSVLYLNDNFNTKNIKSIKIPEGHFFVLSDNRDMGADSRNPEIGLIPMSSIVGQVQTVFFKVKLPSDKLGHVFSWPANLDNERILVKINNDVKQRLELKSEILPVTH